MTPKQTHARAGYEYYYWCMQEQDKSSDIKRTMQMQITKHANIRCTQQSWNGLDRYKFITFSTIFKNIVFIWLNGSCVISLSRRYDRKCFNV